jgi:hypothetical protein
MGNRKLLHAAPVRNKATEWSPPDRRRPSMGSLNGPHSVRKAAGVRRCQPLSADTVNHMAY